MVSAISLDRTAAAKTKLEEVIQARRTKAIRVLEQIEADVPNDALVRGSAARFVPVMTADDGAQVLRPRVRIAYGNQEQEIHQHALQQLAGRADIPGGYLSGLASSGGWGTELAAHILGKHYGAGNGTKYLARSVRGQLRGWLSDHYRRLDARPLVEAFAYNVQQAGAVPIDGMATDVRVSLKAILPTVFEPVPGELMALGLEWGNSDFGRGAHSLRYFAFRLICLNGAVLEDVLNQIHLGARIPESMEMSERTYQLDTGASISALGDAVKGLLQPAGVEATLGAIKAAHEKEVEWKAVQNRVGKRLLKAELDAAREAFNGQDTINLPAGKTAWRASNALSWLAGKAEDPLRGAELERLAGELINGKADKAVQE